jgi:hypothetical protein
VCNIGFGMGIVDGFIAGAAPATHTIVEAHPGVQARVEAAGWRCRPGVHLAFGRWQEFFAPSTANGGTGMGLHSPTLQRNLSRF